MSSLFKILLLSFLSLFTVTANANALVSNGSDGSLIVNGELSLNVMDGQVFNFTTIDINSGGILNLFGSTQASTFSMLASGDINIAGLVNIFTNTVFETPGNISITGTLDLKNNSTVNFSTISSNGLISISGNLLNDGLPIIPNTGGEVKVGPISPKLGLISSPVPEPSSYAILLSGLTLITLARRKSFN